MSDPGHLVCRVRVRTVTDRRDTQPVPPMIPAALTEFTDEEREILAAVDRRLRPEKGDARF